MAFKINKTKVHRPKRDAAAKAEFELTMLDRLYAQADAEGERSVYWELYAARLSKAIAAGLEG